MKKTLLTGAAVAEAATGLALVVFPALVARLLIGAQLAGAGVVMSRVGGLTLIALGVGCWPGSTAANGMLTYSTLMTLYMVFLGLGREWVGPLLWPAMVAHGVLTFLLGRAWFQSRTPDQLNE
jgi:hypothetical protein